MCVSQLSSCSSRRCVQCGLPALMPHSNSWMFRGSQLFILGFPWPALAQGFDLFWHTFLRTITPSCYQSLFWMQGQAPRIGFIFCTVFTWGWSATPTSMSCSRLQPVFVDKHWVNGTWKPTSISSWPQHPFRLSLGTTSESILASTPDNHPTSPGWHVRWNSFLRPGICC